MGFGMTDESENDLPDWLKDLKSGNTGSGFGSGEPLDSDSGGEMPDWMGEPPAEDSSPAREPEEEDVPEWLRSIRDAEKDLKETYSDEAFAEDDDNDEWLENLRKQHEAETGSIKKSPIPPQEPEEEKDFIERIRELKSDEGEDSWDAGDQDDSWENDEEPSEAKSGSGWGAEGQDSDAEEDVPDWLSGLPTLDREEPPSAPAAEETGDDDLPDWLKGIRKQAQAELGAEDAQEAPAQQERSEPIQLDQEEQFPATPPLKDPPPVTGSLPRWLENLQTTGLVLPGETPSQEEEEALPSAASFADEDVSSLLFEPTDLPDWLSEGVPAQEESEEAQEPAQPYIERQEGPIERAELPSWLQAMRPVDAVTTAQDLEEETAPRKEERVGPLAGLNNVLPAEPHIIHFGSPAATPVTDLVLTEAQKNYSRLLKELIAGESSSPPAKRADVALPQQIMRWVIAILLLVALFTAVWLNWSIFDLPNSGIPEENLAVISQVDLLNQGDRVLLAFEYQPGLSGEMEAATTAVVDHLLLKGVELVIVSSQPVGPGLAEHFLQTRQSQHQYVTERRYINLGYVAGGAAGLLNFAISPRSVVPLLDQNSASLWDQAALSGIQSVKDFAMVLVVTDDPDIARNWVEQVQPVLDPGRSGQGTPMAMVVSAQAEPLVYPYYATSPRQVSGIVSGLSGGAFYENTLNRPALSRSYWDGYNIGLWLAVLVIAIGGTLNLARSWFGKGRKGSTK